MLLTIMIEPFTIMIVSSMEIKNSVLLIVIIYCSLICSNKDNTLRTTTLHTIKSISSAVTHNSNQ